MQDVVNLENEDAPYHRRLRVGPAQIWPLTTYSCDGWNEHGCTFLALIDGHNWEIVYTHGGEYEGLYQPSDMINDYPEFRVDKDLAKMLRGAIERMKEVGEQVGMPATEIEGVAYYTEEWIRDLSEGR
jgi:hypothetical protein